MANRPAQTMPATRPKAEDVAKYLLVKKGSLTGFQLEKLLYYCQAWSLAVDKEPLSDNEIRAYQNGPVVPNVSYPSGSGSQVH